MNFEPISWQKFRNLFIWLGLKLARTVRYPHHLQAVCVPTKGRCYWKAELDERPLVKMCASSKLAFIETSYVGRRRASASWLPLA